MTTLKDILNDLAKEVEDITLADGKAGSNDEREQLVKEYVDIICRVLIGHN